MQVGKPLRTAKSSSSIWKGLSEDAFRQTVIALSRATNGVPVDSKRWWSMSRSSQSLATPIECRLLSFQTEKRLADDFAFISAAQEGVETVAAVCIEEIREPMGLVICFAANEGIREEIRNALGEICDCLMSCAQAGRYSCEIWLPHRSHSVKRYLVGGLYFQNERTRTQTLTGAHHLADATVPRASTFSP